MRYFGIISIYLLLIFNVYSDSGNISNQPVDNSTKQLNSISGKILNFFNKYNFLKKQSKEERKRTLSKEILSKTLNKHGNLSVNNNIYKGSVSTYYNDGLISIELNGLSKIYQSENKKHNFFTQVFSKYGLSDPLKIEKQELDIGDKNFASSIGFAYRRLLQNNAILGVNAFYDHTFSWNHKRAGIGVEAIADIFELSTNYYNPLSKLSVKSGITQIPYYGLDISVQVTMPFAKYLKFGLSFDKFFVKSDDARVCAIECKYDYHSTYISSSVNLLPRVKLSFQYQDSKNKDWDKFYNLQLTLLSSSRPYSLFKSNKKDSIKVVEDNLDNRLFSYVKRNHNITVKQSSHTISLSVLFVGNSLSNPVHPHFKQLALYANINARVGTQIEGGIGLYNHLNEDIEGSSIDEKLSNDSWDYVVLQDQSGAPYVNDTISTRGDYIVSELITKIRNAGAKPAFYMTAAFYDSYIRDAYLRQGTRTNSLVVRVMQSFSETAASYGYTYDDLHLDDALHLNDKGAYLAAAVFFVVLTGQKLENNSYHANLSAQEALKLQEIANAYSW